MSDLALSFHVQGVSETMPSCVSHRRRCARNTSCALTHRGDIASLTIWGPGRPSLLLVCDSVMRNRAMMVGRHIQGPAKGAAPYDAMSSPTVSPSAVPSVRVALSRPRRALLAVEELRSTSLFRPASTLPVIVASRRCLGTRTYRACQRSWRT